MKRAFLIKYNLIMALSTEESMKNMKNQQKALVEALSQFGVFCTLEKKLFAYFAWQTHIIFQGF